MIKQYLSNKNENATVSKLKKNRSKQDLIYSFFITLCLLIYKIICRGQGPSSRSLKKVHSPLVHVRNSDFQINKWGFFLIRFSQLLLRSGSGWLPAQGVRGARAQIVHVCTQVDARSRTVQIKHASLGAAVHTTRRVECSLTPFKLT